MSKARRYIEEHKAEKVSLLAVAAAVGASVFHFCKVFHKSTGLTFTDHLARVRAEAARAQLSLNPNRRISEIAYDVGFQSLTQLNLVLSGASTGSRRANSGRRSIGRRVHRSPAGGNKSRKPKNRPAFRNKRPAASRARLHFALTKGWAMKKKIILLVDADADCAGILLQAGVGDRPSHSVEPAQSRRF